MLRTAIAIVAASLLAGRAHAGATDKRLDVYWIDVEGGAATLLVTPGGESVLIDAGNPGARDAGRIHEVATKTAGLQRIDHLVVTHFHSDHYGGVADLAGLMPIGALYDTGVEHAPEGERNHRLVPPYQAAKVERRVTIEPGMTLPLARAGGVKITFVGGRQKFGAPRGRKNAACAKRETKDPDTSDNANSVVTLVQLGKFQFFDGGDLTWNTEGELVCPNDRIGRVDVFQVNHHGLDVSNNPVLVHTLAPTVAVFNNGARKGAQPGSFAALKESPGIQAVYQVHRNLKDEAANTAPEQIANAADPCAGAHIKLSVDGKGRSYTVSVPSTGHTRTFQTK